jgi:hypothetical protein
MSCLQITSKEINLKYVVHCCTMIFSCYDKFEQHNNSEMKVGTLVVSIMAVAAYPFWVKAIFFHFTEKSLQLLMIVALSCPVLFL